MSENSRQAGKASQSARRWIALAIWAAGVALFLGLGWWNLASFRKDSENRLIGEAGRTAAEIAGLLAAPGDRLDGRKARALVMAAMEDDNIYAIKIETRDGPLDGQRRNYMWEPVPWDDELAEDCVQGMNPVRIAGRAEGMVEVWLSPRLNAEEEGLLEKREFWRFLILFLLWSGVFALLLWHWGEFRAWGAALRARHDGGKNISPAVDARDSAAYAGQGLIDPAAGREFQHSSPDAWLVTAGMFRQTFERAPNLINRLYAEGEAAPLCRLARSLEQAAPCVGAEALADAASGMRAALNDPDCSRRGIAVEECARILEETLAALKNVQARKTD